MDIQWHTEARQQPRIIGKDSSGRRIPGGPYTIYQVLAVGGVVPAAMMGFKIIDGGMTIRGFIFALAAGWLAQFVVGRIDWTWSPLAWLSGWWRVTTHAATTPAGMTHTPLWGQTKLRLPTPPRPAPAIPPVWAASTTPNFLDEMIDELDETTDTPATCLLDQALAEDTDTIHKPLPHSKSEPTPRKPLHPTGNAVRRSGLEAFLAAAEKES